MAFHYSGLGRLDQRTGERQVKRLTVVGFLLLDLFRNCTVMIPSLFKVGRDNPIPCLIHPRINGPVEMTFELKVNNSTFPVNGSCQPGESCTINMRLPKSFPTGPGTVTTTNNRGLDCGKPEMVDVQRRNLSIIIQTSASTYRPGDTMEISVIATNENLMPLNDKPLRLEIYV